jgi:predicted RecB family nuclease
MARVQELLSEIDAIRETGECPLPHLAAACKQSPWFKECVHLAESSDDAALLYNVKRRSLQRFRDAGFKTVADMIAGDFSPLLGTGSDMTEDNLARVKLQAQALKEQRHFVRRPYRLPAANTEIFFDIESDGLRGSFDYLFGFVIRDATGVRYEKFVAEKPEEEEKMWRDFLRWFGQIPVDCAVYHFGDHERHSLAVLEARYCGSKSLTRFRAAMRDLNEIVKDSLVFPLYFYGLKEIGGYIGYQRQAEIAHGAVSVEYYERWLAEQQRAYLDAIIEYNKEDCEATEALKDWLVKEAQTK